MTQPLNLKKPICFFDLETTGINVAKDRIVEIFILKVLPTDEPPAEQGTLFAVNEAADNPTEELYYMLNPEMHIPEEASKVHGIYDEDVANKQTFRQVVGEIVNFIGDSDLAGYNSEHFDMIILAEEFARTGVDFDFKNRQSVDVFTLFTKMEPRNLKAAVKFYLNRDFEDAHAAKADVIATYEILKAQIARYNQLENDITKLSEMTSLLNRNVDMAGYIVRDKDGREIINFGKNKNRTVRDLIRHDMSYIDWMLKGDFPLTTKKEIIKICKEENIRCGR
ncbi:MAG: 3'-5' exonuclease [Bacteroidales bacterium]|jgi:DNA polymerase-3 subunit epsilon|nr:3'-5' exonuclease [Bacteroidales bacterium]